MVLIFPDSMTLNFLEKSSFLIDKTPFLKKECTFKEIFCITFFGYFPKKKIEILEVNNKKKAIEL